MRPFVETEEKFPENAVRVGLECEGQNPQVGPAALGPLWPEVRTKAWRAEIRLVAVKESHGHTISNRIKRVHDGL